MVAKRKSDAGSSSSNKKARFDTSNAEALVRDILSNPTGYAIPDDDNVIRQSLVDLANYAVYLRDSAQQQSSSNVLPPKTTEQLEDAAEKVAKAARSGIKKQMTASFCDLKASYHQNDASYQWKPSCKTGSAKFNYDGLCADPEVFGHLLGLGGPPTFKMKKFPSAEFQDLVGDLSANAR